MECQSRVSMEGIDQHLTTDDISTHDQFSLCTCRVTGSSGIPLLSPLVTPLL